jgi:hypothetical protein
MNMAIFWVVAPCRMAHFTNVSEDLRPDDGGSTEL